MTDPEVKIEQSPDRGIEDFASFLVEGHEIEDAQTLSDHFETAAELSSSIGIEEGTVLGEDLREIARKAIEESKRLVEDKQPQAESDEERRTRHVASALTRLIKGESFGQILADESKETESKASSQYLETRGFVRVPPRFSEQAQDSSRDNKFTHIRSKRPLGTQDMSVLRRSEKNIFRQSRSEAKGLEELRSFLRRFLDESERAGTEAADSGYIETEVAKTRATAESMLDNLTFIGEKEYEEAIHGLAAYWKEFLEGGVKRQLCIVTPTSFNSKYAKQRKSDVFLRDRILDTFTDKELERYSGRIVTSMDDISTRPRRTKVVILDDWIISGGQMSDSIKALQKDPRFKNYQKTLEINLIAGQQGAINEGFHPSGTDSGDPAIPVKSYFIAHAASPGTSEYGTHITGVHSSVNHDFETPVSRMVSIMNALGGLKKEAVMPLLTNIERQYRSMQLAVRVSPKKLIRAPKRGS